jgi:hypothetical protein
MMVALFATTLLVLIPGSVTYGTVSTGRVLYVFGLGTSGLFGVLPV